MNKDLDPIALLSKVEALLDPPPTLDTIDTQWVGRATAVVKKYDRFLGAKFSGLTSGLNSIADFHQSAAASQMISVLHEVKESLMLDLGEAQTVVIEAGQPFKFFEAIRQELIKATSLVFFIDPWIDGDFVGRYLPHIEKDVSISILSKQTKYTAQLMAGLEVYQKEANPKIEVRTFPDLHDRCLIIDNDKTMAIGSSFNHAGDTKPTSIITVNDGSQALQDVYKKIWESAEKLFVST